MDDWEMARLAIRTLSNAARLAEREKRRREREQRASTSGAGARRQAGIGGNGAGGASGADDGASPLRRQPEFEMPANADGEIPDEFLPHG